jgi:hypothetical protein
MKKVRLLIFPVNKVRSLVISSIIALCVLLLNLFFYADIQISIEAWSSEEGMHSSVQGSTFFDRACETIEGLFENSR